VSCIQPASAGRAWAGRPRRHQSRIANEVRNSPPPAAMSRFRSGKFTSANTCWRRSIAATPPETQLEVPDAMPRVWLAQVELVVVAARIWAPGLLVGPKTIAPSPQPAIPYQAPAYGGGGAGRGPPAHFANAAPSPAAQPRRTMTIAVIHPNLHCDGSSQDAGMNHRHLDTMSSTAH